MANKTNHVISKSIIVAGISYSSIKKACKALNVNYSGTMYRLYKGQSPEEAFEPGNRHKERKFIQISKQCISIEKVNEAINKGISKQTLATRLRLGWNLEEALTRKPGRHVVVLNKVYENMLLACRQHGVDYTTIRRRIVAGMSIDDAFNRTINNEKQTGIVYLISNSVNSKKYVGITTNDVNRRLKHHISFAYSKSKFAINRKFSKAIREIGPENFSIEVIYSSPIWKNVKHKENVFIKKYDSVKNGYNSNGELKTKFYFILNKAG